MEECTFYPQGLSKKSETTKFDANEFYQRNIEWKQKVEAEDSKKQDDQLKLVTVKTLFILHKNNLFKLSSEKSKAQRSNENSKILKPQQIMTQQRQSFKKTDTPLSGRSYAKRAAQEEKKLGEKERR